VTARFELLEREDAEEIGLYRVDDIYGTVRGIAAGDPGYAAAALAADRAKVVFARADRESASKQLTLEGGALYAFYVVLRDDHDDGHRDRCDSRMALFSIAEANANGRDYMHANIDAAGKLTIGWDESDGDAHDDDRDARDDDDRDDDDRDDNRSRRGHGDDDDDCGDDRDDGTVVRATGFTLPAQTTSYTYDADAVDIDGDTLTYTLVDAPNGATIDAATGLLNWAPRASGQYHFVIRVEDGQGGSADQAYNLDVTRGERLLEVRGTDCNDQIEVSEDEGGIVRVTVNGATRYYSGITAIHVDALGGNDQVRLKGLTASTLVEAGAGNDKIDGSSVIVARLELRGDAGNDDLRGGANADYLVGGDGNDVLRGGAGGDWILGGLGKDVLFGEDGNDVLVGGEGDDIVKGGNGDDILIRGPGNDNLDGGCGNNRTVDYAAFIAGTVPGMPTPPASMLDWLMVKPVDASPRADCSKPRKPSEPQMPSIDWNCAQVLRAVWGFANPFQRKPGMADFAEPEGVKESGRHSSAPIDLDRKDSMPGWKFFE
jgi:hypothetical protein